eukprot:5471781-Amphidinium_carterae.1
MHLLETTSQRRASQPGHRRQHLVPEFKRIESVRSSQLRLPRDVLELADGSKAKVLEVTGDPERELDTYI